MPQSFGIFTIKHYSLTVKVCSFLTVLMIYRTYCTDWFFMFTVFWQLSAPELRFNGKKTVDCFICIEHELSLCLISCYFNTRKNSVEK